MGEKEGQPRILYPVKLSLNNEEKFRPKEQWQRIFDTIQADLQQILSKVFGVKGH